MSARRSLQFGGGHDPAPVVCGVAAWNALAFSAYQTWAFRRAEMTALVPSPFRCRNGNRAAMAAIRTLPPRSVGVSRMLAVASTLLEELLRTVARLGPSSTVALVTCLPERMGAGGAQRFKNERTVLERALAQQAELRGMKILPYTVPRGHAALAFAMTEVADALSRHVDAAIVGGVDTYYDGRVVEDLLESGRLFDGENLDSFIPGEGGAFAIVARRETARQMQWPILARIETVATDSEPGNLANSVACMAVGLSRAANAASDRLRQDRRTLDWWISDATTEHYRIQELQQAAARASWGVTDTTSTLELMAPYLGDLGAATMPTALAIATEGFRREGPDARTFLTTGSSVGEDRGAILLAREEARDVSR